MNNKNIKKTVIRTVATGALAAVMAVGVAMPGSASAASSQQGTTSSNWKTVVKSYLNTNNNDLYSFSLTSNSDLMKKIQSFLDQIQKQQDQTTAAPAPTEQAPAEQAPSKEDAAKPAEETPAKESTPAKDTTTNKPDAEANDSKQENATTKPSTETTKPSTETTKPSTETTKPSNTNTSTTANDSSSFVAEVIRLVNVERTKAGLSTLTEDTNLSKVALVKATDMKTNNYFSHTSPTYGSPFDMMKQFGISYKYAGENIAMGQKTPAAVMEAWMNSEGHRANILSSNFTHIGVGYDGGYWVQQFISK